MNAVTNKLLAPLAFVFTMACSSAQAIMINDINAGAWNGTDVGGLDTFLVEDEKQGNPASELAWVNAFLSPDSTTYNGHKTEDVAYFSTDTSNVYAFLLGSDPEYFAVKNARRIALFENVGDLGWGVIDVSLLSDSMNLPDLEEMEISHVTEFGQGESTSVSEPQTLAILSLGLLGLVAIRRTNAAS